MPVTINASTSSGVVITPDYSGNIQLQYNGQTAPAFSAYANAGSNQSISASTWTKVTLGAELFDTNNNFASSRFTPTVAGYYQINAACSNNWTSTGPRLVGVSIYKNGSEYATQFFDTAYFGTTPQLYISGFPISTVVYCNGTADYIEMYAYSSSASATISQYQASTFLSGCLLRGA